MRITDIANSLSCSSYQLFRQQSWSTTSHSTTPPSPWYEGGENFCCCACQGCKKGEGIKMPVNYAFEDKTLSIIQTNCVIKAVKDEKLPKWWNDLLRCICFCPHCLESLVAKPLRNLHQEGSGEIFVFKPKRSGLSSQDWFPCRDDAPVHTAASVHEST